MEAGAEDFKQEDVIMWAHFDAMWRMDQRVKRGYNLIHCGRSLQDKWLCA